MRKLILPLLGLLLCLCPNIAQARDSHVVMVIAGSASIRDFADPSLPEFSKLFECSSAAILNVRAGRPSRDSELGTKSGFESGCVSIGAGAMATAGAEASRAGSSTSAINGLNVGDLYKARTNLNYRREQVLHIEIAKLSRINAAASYRAKPGALGSALREAGIRTAIIGNSDIAEGLHREAVTIAMDVNGVVDWGQVDGDIFYQPDPKSPFGRRTDFNYLLDKAEEALSKARFVVIDYGDTFRADEYAESCTDHQALAIRHAADERLSLFVGALAKKLNPNNDLLIVLSPNARGFSEIGGEKMGAILISGPGFGGGMLISPSTRRPGVVTLCDVAPTILAYFALQPTPEIVGRPMVQTGGGSAKDKLLAMNESASLQVQRQVAMRGVGVAQSVIVCIVMAAILFITSSPIRKSAAWLVTIVVALPLAMLYLPLIYSGGLVGSVVALVLLTLAVIGLFLLVFRSPAKAFVWMCGVMVISLMIDLLRSGPLMLASIAGYNIIEGARYYGIGNELMGTLMGATIAGMGMILAAGRLGSRMAGLLLAAVFGIVFVFVAAPGLGAKVGGAIAIAPAMAAMVLARRGWKPNLKSVAIVVLVTVLLVGAMFVVDALRSGSEQSHAGRVAGLAAGGDISGLSGIFARKLALNFMLVANSVWSRLLGLCLAGSAVLAWWGRRLHGEAFLDREEAAAALGCCVGTVAAFLFNDSGVLAGATCSVFLWAMLALKLLDRKKKCPEV